MNSHASLPSPLETPALLAQFGDRLVTLCDGRTGVRGSLPAEIREPSDIVGASGTAPILDFIASSDALDRCGEVIVPGGWRLDNYRRNPVFQNAHQYGDIIFTLGKALITEVRHGDLAHPNAALHVPHLFQRIEFAVEANPMARIAYGLYKGRFLNAVSVGFIPLRWINADGTEHALSRTATGISPGNEPPSGAALDDVPAVPARSGTGTTPAPRRRYLEQELLEVSAVGIPANPEALQLGLKAGAVEKADLRELLDLLSALAGSKCEVARAKCEVGSWKGELPPLTHSPTLSLTDSPAHSPTNSFRSHTAGAAANTRARGDGANGAQLLHLARALRDLLRRN